MTNIDNIQKGDTFKIPQTIILPNAFPSKMELKDSIAHEIIFNEEPHNCFCILKNTNPIKVKYAGKPVDFNVLYKAKTKKGKPMLIAEPTDKNFSYSGNEIFIGGMDYACRDGKLILGRRSWEEEFELTTEKVHEKYPILEGHNKFFFLDSLWYNPLDTKKTDTLYFLENKTLTPIKRNIGNSDEEKKLINLMQETIKKGFGPNQPFILLQNGCNSSQGNAEYYRKYLGLEAIGLVNDKNKFF